MDHKVSLKIANFNFLSYFLVLLLREFYVATLNLQFSCLGENWVATAQQENVWCCMLAYSIFSFLSVRVMQISNSKFAYMCGMVLHNHNALSLAWQSLPKEPVGIEWCKKSTVKKSIWSILLRSLFVVFDGIPGSSTFYQTEISSQAIWESGVGSLLGSRPQSSSGGARNNLPFLEIP